jgi:uncharacterized protein with FMN-binding domain
MIKMVQGVSNKKVANSLVALSSAAVLAVYSAGYLRTRSVADQLEAHSPQRRPAPPGGPRTGSTAAPLRLPAPEASAERDASREPTLGAAVEPLRTSDASAGGTAPRPSSASSSTSPAVTPARDVTPAPTSASQPSAQNYSFFLPPPPTPEFQPPLIPAAPTAETRAQMATAAPMWKDGTYYGWGSCRHGDIQAKVHVEGGRIVLASISECDTRYSCSVIERLPPEVAQRQSAQVDYVSGATESADAFHYAVLDALSKAK